jgi:hypothetical protein
MAKGLEPVVTNRKAGGSELIRDIIARRLQGLGGRSMMPDPNNPFKMFPQSVLGNLSDPFLNGPF